jgi:hypothetical protein
MERLAIIVGSDQELLEIVFGDLGAIGPHRSFDVFEKGTLLCPLK